MLNAHNSCSETVPLNEPLTKPYGSLKSTGRAETNKQKTWWAVHAQSCETEGE